MPTLSVVVIVVESIEVSYFTVKFCSTHILTARTPIAASEGCEASFLLPFQIVPELRKMTYRWRQVLD